MTHNPNDPTVWHPGDPPAQALNDMTGHIEVGDQKEWFFWDGYKWTAFSQLAALWSAAAAMRNRMGMLALQPELRKLAEEHYEVLHAALEEGTHQLAAEIADNIAVLIGVAQQRGVSPEMLEQAMRQCVIGLDKIDHPTHKLDRNGILQKK